MSEENERDLPIKSKRYKLEMVIGKGTWGTIYSANDSFTGARVAVKVLTPSEMAQKQMEYRGLTTAGVMSREAGFRASRHVLPRIYEIDEDGVPFIVMPICPGTLATVLHESSSRGSRNSINLGYPDEKRGFQYMKDILSGLGELHQIYSRTYGDWKPENIMVDEHDRLILNDLGTSSCISMTRREGSPRDNMGHIQTRAPELFKEGSHPTRESDIYGASSLLFRIHCGEYPLEEEFEQIIMSLKSPIEAERKIREFLERKNGWEINDMLWRKIKSKVPKEWRNFYMEGMEFNPGSRYGDAAIASRQLEEAILKSSTKYKLSRLNREYSTAVIIPLILLAVIGGSGILRKYNTNLPPKPSLSGPLYPQREPNETTERFDIENLDLPALTNLNPTNELDYEQKNAFLTRDNTTAFFLTQYNLAMDAHKDRKIDFVNDEQFRIWLAHTDSSQRVSMGGNYWADYDRVVKNIEVALNQARLPNSRIDLEDVCAIARVGRDKVDLAKRASGSFDFANYIDAKDSKGKPIIQKSEAEFIKTWLAYIHANNRDKR